MSFKLKNMDVVLREVESRLGKAKMQGVIDAALQDGAAVFVEKLKQNFESFKDTGESINEITISAPFTKNGSRQVKIHWKGPNGRFRIIHLNEWGTVKNPNPKGKGAVASALKSSQNAYRAALKKRLGAR